MESNQEGWRGKIQEVLTSHESQEAAFREAIRDERPDKIRKCCVTMATVNYTREELYIKDSAKHLLTTTRVEYFPVILKMLNKSLSEMQRMKLDYF
jgi:hypothetical protein